MAYSTMIGKCELCKQNYCQECTDATKWQQYCSQRCQDEAEKEQQTEEGKESA